MNKHRAAALLRELAEDPDLLRRLADEIENQDEPVDEQPARRARAIRQPEVRKVDTADVTDLDRARAERSLRRKGVRTR